MLIKRILIPSMVILTFVLQLMTPVVVRADDGAPPPDSTEVAPVVVEEVPPPDPTEVAPAVVEEVPTVPEILDQAPEGTEIVVLNTDGSIEPLATQAAAEAIATSDPIWCPAVQTTPTPGANGCTPSQATVDDLLNTISGDPTYNGDGTIFFTTDYHTDDIYINGGDDRVANLDNLAIVGDTGGGAAATLTVPVFIAEWWGDIHIGNLNIDLTSYTPELLRSRCWN